MLGNLERDDDLVWKRKRRTMVETTIFTVTQLAKWTKILDRFKMGFPANRPSEMILKWRRPLEHTVTVNVDAIVSLEDQTEEYGWWLEKRDEKLRVFT